MEARWWLIGVWAQLVFALLLGRLWRTVATIAKQRRMVEALDKINGKYGDFTVCRVPVLRAGQVFRDSVGFGRIKELTKLNKNEQK